MYFLVGLAIVLATLSWAGWRSLPSRRRNNAPVSSLDHIAVANIIEEALADLERGREPQSPRWNEFVDAKFEEPALIRAQRQWQAYGDEDLDREYADMAEKLREIVTELRGSGR